MCGICGFVRPGADQAFEQLTESGQHMVAALRHRGPDDGGLWIDPRLGVALGHRRLAILDLSRGGHQPMHSRDQRYVMAFNGEIYNYHNLRGQLGSLGFTFESRSDTEVMLHAFQAWGVQKALETFVGMFAFALWDRSEEVLYLARDRMGEKPLYYGWSGPTFLFGSELKALQVHPEWQGRIDSTALPAFLQYGYVPTPRSIFEGIYKLPPGQVLTLSSACWVRRQLLQPKAYWSLAGVARAGMARPFVGTDEDAADHLFGLLSDAVRMQMMADVPLGAFLSGGVDSSTVAGLMQRGSRRPIRTFSIGFEDKDYDEASHARSVALHLGTDHTEFYVQATELQHVITRLPLIYDEPFSDSSQIPTVLLCELARQQVTVSLSGDGGDELFGGYDQYEEAPALWQRLRGVPQPVRACLARCLQPVAEAGLNPRFHLGPVTGFLRRLAEYSEILAVDSEIELYRLIMSSCRSPHRWLVGGAGAALPGEDSTAGEFLESPLQQMMFSDSVTYLPDDILVKVDRAAMAVALETRMPLLDHRVVEFAWSLPLSLKIRKGRRKWLLRQVLARLVPTPLVDRPKRGFGVPLGDWLRGPLRDWAEGLLSETRLKRDGFFNPKVVGRRWAEHQRKVRDSASLLWSVLVFQAWLETQGKAHNSPATDEESFSQASRVETSEAGILR